MESKESSQLEGIMNDNRVEIVERLHLERTFLFDYLLSKSVFDRNDCDLVRAQPTREGKASKFLDILETKGPDGLDHFVNALQLVNPSLYELVTGEKATTKASPIIMNGHFSSGDSNFLDLDVLSSYAKRVTGDIQDMTIRYEQVLKEKEQLQRALKEENDKYHSEKRQKESLQQKISETEEILTNKANRRAREEDEQFAHHMKCIHEDNDTKQFIIQLQMRLLAAHDENENIMRHMMQRLEQADRNSDNGNCETFRLSQRMKSHSEETTKIFRQCSRFNPVEASYHCAEQLREELQNLKLWTEALKMRFDIAMQERNEMIQKCEDLTQKHSELADNLSQLEIRLKQVQRENKDWKKSCQEMEQNVASYRRQHEIDEREMKEALKKRDQAIHDLDEASRHYKEDLEFKERTIRQQTRDERTFEKRCRENRAELGRVRTQLREALQENEELRTTGLARLQSNRTRYNSESSEDESGMENSEQKPESEVPSNPSQLESGGSCQFSCFRTRSTTEVVRSIKRRVWNSRHTERVAKTPLGLRRSASLDTLLSELLPAFRDLPSETKNAVSLDRFKPKQALPYETIFGMYPQKGPECALSASFGRSCQATRPRSRGRSEPITSEEEKMSRPCSDLGCGGEEMDKLSQEEREGKKEREEGSTSESFRPRSSPLVNRKAKRHFNL